MALFVWSEGRIPDEHTVREEKTVAKVFCDCTLTTKVLVVEMKQTENAKLQTRRRWRSVAHMDDRELNFEPGSVRCSQQGNANRMETGQLTSRWKQLPAKVPVRLWVCNRSQRTTGRNGLLSALCVKGKVRAGSANAT